MRIEISVPEVVSVFKEIQAQPEKVFEMIRLDVREMVGERERQQEAKRKSNSRKGLRKKR